MDGLNVLKNEMRVYYADCAMDLVQMAVESRIIQERHYSFTWYNGGLELAVLSQ